MFDLLRNLTKTEEEKQQEKLSAYLDNALTPQEQRQFEEELAADSALQAEMERQRLLKQNLAALPRMQAPHNFTLDPALYGRPAPQRAYQLYPVMRVATAVTALFLVMLFSIELLGPLRESAGTAAQAPQVLSETTATEPSIMREAPDEEDMAADSESAEAPAALPEAANGAAGAEEAVEEVEEAAEAEEPMEEALTTSQAESEAGGDTITDTVEPAGESGLLGSPTPEIAPLPAPVTDGYSYGLTPTQQLAPTSASNLRATTPSDDDLGPRPTPAGVESVTQEPALPTIRLLQIGLGAIFLVLLAGTWLLRRQL